MPLYAYRCEVCGFEFDKFACISERDGPQECPDCQSVAKRRVVMPNMIFAGDDWTSKNLRVKRQMEKRRSTLAVRENEQKQDGAVPRLVPNVGGEQVASWSEAKKLAASQGKDTTGYDRKIK